MHDDRLEILQMDITRLHVDVIVNAAKSSLLGGGGVDGAIHRAAGPNLLAECRTLDGCHTGEAKITGGYNLPARFVIHTVGPIWHGGTHNEDELLARCYHNALSLAAAHNLKTIAFPSISTGVYGFPIRRACRIALREILQFLAGNQSLARVIAVCFSRADYQVYIDARGELDQD